MFNSPQNPRARRPWHMSWARGWHGLYIPGIYAARTAAAISDIVNIAAGVSGVDFTPSNAWHFDEEGNTDNAVDYIGSSAALVSQGVNATRITTGVYAGDRAASELLGSTTGYWKLGNTTDMNMTTNAWAFAARIRVRAIGSGAWWLSKSSNTANGYYSAGLDSFGQLSVGCRATDGTVANATALAANVADSTWRWVLFGRTITSTSVWIYHAAASSGAAFAAAKDIGNTTAGAAFMLGFNLFGTAGGGMTGDVAQLVCWKGAPAESIYTNRAGLISGLENA